MIMSSSGRPIWAKLRRFVCHRSNVGWSSLGASYVTAIYPVEGRIPDDDGSFVGCLLMEHQLRCGGLRIGSFLSCTAKHHRELGCGYRRLAQPWNDGRAKSESLSDFSDVDALLALPR